MPRSAPAIGSIRSEPAPMQAEEEARRQLEGPKEISNTSKKMQELLGNLAAMLRAENATTMSYWLRLPHLRCQLVMIPIKE